MVEKNKKKIIFIITSIILVLIIVTSKKYYTDFLWTSKPSEVKKWTASTKVLISEEKIETELNRIFGIQKDKYKELINYPTIPIPGLRGAWSLKKDKVSFGVDWVPQGLAVSKKNLFVSAYDKKHQLNSIVYVIDKVTGKYIKTIILDTKAHVGGLGYDIKFERLWVSTDTSTSARLTVFSQKQIDEYQASTSQESIKSGDKFDIKWWSNISSLSVSENTLSIAYYDSEKKGNIVQLPLNSNGRLNEKQINNYVDLKKDGNHMVVIDGHGLLDGARVITGKPRMQGLSFSENLLFLSQSNGVLASKVGIYELKNIGNEKGKIKYGDLKEKDELSIPSGVEQVAVDPYVNRIYIIFESGARPYRVNSFEIMDRIISLNYK